MTRQSNNRPADPAWIVLLDSWKPIVLGTVFVCLAAFLIALLLPKSYLVVTSIQTLVPEYAKRLAIPPEPVHVRTLRTLATAPTILDSLIERIQKQKAIVETLALRLSEEDPEGKGLWEKIAQMSASEAASLLEIELDDEFKNAWEDLPPAELLVGYSHFSDKKLRKMDSLVLAQRLSASTHSSRETNITTEYQPILTLKVEWGTEESAAIVAHCWARTILRYFETSYVVPTEHLQQNKQQAGEGFEKRISELAAQEEAIVRDSSYFANLSQRDFRLQQLYGLSQEEIAQGTKSISSDQPTNLQSLLSLLNEYELRAASAEFARSRVDGLLEWIEFEGRWVGDYEVQEMVNRSDISNMAEKARTLVNKATGGDEVSADLRRGAESLLQTLDLRRRSSEWRGRIHTAFKSSDLAGMIETLRTKQSLLDEAGSSPREGPRAIGSDKSELDPREIERLKTEMAALDKAVRDASLEIVSLEFELTTCEDLLAEQRRFYDDCRRELADLMMKANEARTKRDSLVKSKGISREEVARFNALVLRTQSDLERLHVDRETVDRAYQEFLDRGGTEATVTDYARAIGLRTPDSPVLPKRKFKPRIWVICLVSGLLAFFALSFWVVIADRCSRSWEPE